MSIFTGVGWPPAAEMRTDRTSTWREHDYVVPVPGAASGCPGVGERSDLSRLYVNRLELALSKESDRLAVR